MSAKSIGFNLAALMLAPVIAPVAWFFTPPAEHPDAVRDREYWSERTTANGQFIDPTPSQESFNLYVRDRNDAEIQYAANCDKFAGDVDARSAAYYQKIARQDAAYARHVDWERVFGGGS